MNMDKYSDMEGIFGKEKNFLTNFRIPKRKPPETKTTSTSDANVTDVNNNTSSEEASTPRNAVRLEEAVQKDNNPEENFSSHGSEEEAYFSDDYEKSFYESGNEPAPLHNEQEGNVGRSGSNQVDKKSHLFGQGANSSTASHPYQRQLFSKPILTSRKCFTPPLARQEHIPPLIPPRGANTQPRKQSCQRYPGMYNFYQPAFGKPFGAFRESHLSAGMRPGGPETQLAATVKFRPSLFGPGTFVVTEPQMSLKHKISPKQQSDVFSKSGYCRKLNDSKREAHSSAVEDLSSVKTKVTFLVNLDKMWCKECKELHEAKEKCPKKNSTLNSTIDDSLSDTISSIHREWNSDADISIDIQDGSHMDKSVSTQGTTGSNEKTESHTSPQNFGTSKLHDSENSKQELFGCTSPKYSPPPISRVDVSMSQSPVCKPPSDAESVKSEMQLFKPLKKLHIQKELSPEKENPIKSPISTAGVSLAERKSAIFNKTEGGCVKFGEVPRNLLSASQNKLQEETLSQPYYTYKPETVNFSKIRQDLYQTNSSLFGDTIIQNGSLQHVQGEQDKQSAWGNVSLCKDLHVTQVTMTVPNRTHHAHREAPFIRNNSYTVAGNDGAGEYTGTLPTTSTDQRVCGSIMACGSCVSSFSNQHKGWGVSPPLEQDRVQPFSSLGRSSISPASFMEDEPWKQLNPIVTKNDMKQASDRDLYTSPPQAKDRMNLFPLLDHTPVSPESFIRTDPWVHLKPMTSRDDMEDFSDGDFYEYPSVDETISSEPSDPEVKARKTEVQVLKELTDYNCMPHPDCAEAPSPSPSIDKAIKQWTNWRSGQCKAKVTDKNDDKPKIQKHFLEDKQGTKSDRGIVEDKVKLKRVKKELADISCPPQDQQCGTSDECNIVVALMTSPKNKHSQSKDNCGTIVAMMNKPLSQNVKKCKNKDGWLCKAFGGALNQVNGLSDKKEAQSSGFAHLVSNTSNENPVKIKEQTDELPKQEAANVCPAFDEGIHVEVLKDETLVSSNRYRTLNEINTVEESGSVSSGQLNQEGDVESNFSDELKEVYQGLDPGDSAEEPGHMLDPAANTSIVGRSSVDEECPRDFMEESFTMTGSEIYTSLDHSKEEDDCHLHDSVPVSSKADKTNDSTLDGSMDNVQLPNVGCRGKCYKSEMLQLDAAKADFLEAIKLGINKNLAVVKENNRTESLETSYDIDHAHVADPFVENHLDSGEVNETERRPMVILHDVRSVSEDSIADKGEVEEVQDEQCSDLENPGPQSKVLSDIWCNEILESKKMEDPKSIPSKLSDDGNILLPSIVSCPDNLPPVPLDSSTPKKNPKNLSKPPVALSDSFSIELNRSYFMSTSADDSNPAMFCHNELNNNMNNKEGANHSVEEVQPIQLFRNANDQCSKTDIAFEVHVCPDQREHKILSQTDVSADEQTVQSPVPDSHVLDCQNGTKQEKRKLSCDENDYGNQKCESLKKRRGESGVTEVTNRDQMLRQDLYLSSDTIDTSVEPDSSKDVLIIDENAGNSFYDQHRDMSFLTCSSALCADTNANQNESVSKRGIKGGFFELRKLLEEARDFANKPFNKRAETQPWKQDMNLLLKEASELAAEMKSRRIQGNQNLEIFEGHPQYALRSHSSICTAPGQVNLRTKGTKTKNKVQSTLENENTSGSSEEMSSKKKSPSLYIYTCPYCFQPFNRKTKLRIHLAHCKKAKQTPKVATAVKALTYKLKSSSGSSGGNLTQSPTEQELMANMQKKQSGKKNIRGRSDSQSPKDLVIALQETPPKDLPPTRASRKRSISETSVIDLTEPDCVDLTGADTSIAKSLFLGSVKRGRGRPKRHLVDNLSSLLQLPKSDSVSSQRNTRSRRVFMGQQVTVEAGAQQHQRGTSVEREKTNSKKADGNSGPKKGSVSCIHDKKDTQTYRKKKEEQKKKAGRVSNMSYKKKKEQKKKISEVKSVNHKRRKECKKRSEKASHDQKKENSSLEKTKAKRQKLKRYEKARKVLSLSDSDGESSEESLRNKAKKQYLQSVAKQTNSDSDLSDDSYRQVSRNRCRKKYKQRGVTQKNDDSSFTGESNDETAEKCSKWEYMQRVQTSQKNGGKHESTRKMNSSRSKMKKEDARQKASEIHRRSKPVLSSNKHNDFNFESDQEIQMKYSKRAYKQRATSQKNRAKHDSPDKMDTSTSKNKMEDGKQKAIEIYKKSNSYNKLSKLRREFKFSNLEKRDNTQYEDRCYSHDSIKTPKGQLLTIHKKNNANNPKRFMNFAPDFVSKGKSIYKPEKKPEEKLEKQEECLSKDGIPLYKLGHLKGKDSLGKPVIPHSRVDRENRKEDHEDQKMEQKGKIYEPGLVGLPHGFQLRVVDGEEAAMYKKAFEDSKSRKCCLYCGKGFITESNDLMRWHVKQTHPWICRLCKVAFGSEKECEDHMKEHFKDKYSCKLCRKIYASEKPYQRHLTSKMHQQNLVLQQDIINDLLDRKIIKEKDAREHRGETVVSTTCGMSDEKKGKTEQKGEKVSCQIAVSELKIDENQQSASDHHDHNDVSSSLESEVLDALVALETASDHREKKSPTCTVSRPPDGNSHGSTKNASSQQGFKEQNSLAKHTDACLKSGFHVGEKSVLTPTCSKTPSTQGASPKDVHDEARLGFQHEISMSPLSSLPDRNQGNLSLPNFLARSSSPRRPFVFGVSDPWDLHDALLGPEVDSPSTRVPVTRPETPIFQGPIVSASEVLYGQSCPSPISSGTCVVNESGSCFTQCSKAT